MGSDLDHLFEANRSYAESFAYGELRPQAARGLGVLTCIDSRIEPLQMLGLEPGDAKIVRNAGARVTEDALRSLVIAANFLDVRTIVVVAHTGCAMAGTTDEELRSTLRERYPDGDVDDLPIHAMSDQHAALRDDVERLRQCTLFPQGTTFRGLEYDVRTGLLRTVVE